MNIFVIASCGVFLPNQFLSLLCFALSFVVLSSMHD